MTSGVYYNENDPKAAAVLRELSKAGLIARGEVDDRSICDVSADDLKGFAQWHFFAGFGGWSVALRLAGWPDDEAVCTGSCPCQPYSIGGAGLGDDDPRALWWAYRWLIENARFPVVLGEQVASPAGRQWFSGVRSDLEVLGGDVGAADLCAACVGTPHIRQRLFFVSDHRRGRKTRGGGHGAPAAARRARVESVTDGELRAVSDSTRGGLGINGRASGASGHVDELRTSGGLSDAHGGVTGNERIQRGRQHGQQPKDGLFVPLSLLNPHGTGRGEQCGPVAMGTELAAAERSSAWSDYYVLEFADGKKRRVPTERTFFPVVNGVQPGRVASLRGSGNAIVPHVASEFILAYREVVEA